MPLPRCQVTPLADHQVAFSIDGRERLRWHYGSQYPRPFFFPLVGPTGIPLTRMGHPGAPDHDHHRSIWFAHNKVLGIDFWSDQTDARIRQKQWLAYEDGDEALMAVRLVWLDGHEPKELLQQELIAAVRPGPQPGETFLELQSTFTPTAETFELGQTNFGFLAVRVAKSISVHFGGGKLTNSAGHEGEKAIFGKPARWMDYSGPVAGKDGGDGVVMEGITYFDHTSNPGQPTHWHVREDGWMGASPCMNAPLTVMRAKPLVLRYLLYAHGGAVDAAAADKVAAQFEAAPAYDVVKATVPHRQWQVRRRPN